MTASAIPTVDEVIEEVQALSETQLSALRLRAQNDLYFMSKGVLGRKDVNPHTHGAFCRFVDSEPKKRRLGLMPRSHLKSTIDTVDDSIRLVCKAPEDTRILIAGEKAKLAEDFLDEIKNLWRNSKLLRLLFRELVPSKFAGPDTDWSTARASVNRSATHKEAHWNVIGVGGSIIGFHFSRIKADDLIGFEASRSPAVMETTIQWAKNIESLLINQHVDIIDFVGTRWARNDLYNHLMKFYGSSLAVYTREAIENGQIIFPQLHTMEEYERLQREAPEIWYSQYCNNPLAGGLTDFPPPQTFHFSPDGRAVVYHDDAGIEQRWSLDELDRVLTADPNGGSKTAEDTAALSIQGVSPKDEVFVLHARSGRPSPSEFVDWIFEDARRWKVRVIGIEQAGQQSTQHYFDKKQTDEGTSFRVVPVKHKNRNKIERIRAALEPIGRSKRIYMLPTQTTLRQQWDGFPNVDIIDDLDVLAYGPQLWRKPLDAETNAKTDRALKLVLGARRRSRTGY